MRPPPLRAKEKETNFNWVLFMSYRDIFKSLAALHGIILSERHLRRILRIGGLYR